MKTAKKILSVFLAVLMLFSVMSVGMGGIMSTAATVSSQTGNDTYATTDNVIICVPETVYMTPSLGASTTAQYFVNNKVNASGVVALTAESAQNAGSLSIYAPGATAFSFTAAPVAGSGIGNTVVCYTGNHSEVFNNGTRYNNTDVGGSTGYASYDYLYLYINGTGLSAGRTAVVEWQFTLYYGDSDTTGKTYLAYSTLYSPIYNSVGATTETRGTSDYGNQVTSWVTGLTGVTGSQIAVGGHGMNDDSGSLVTGSYKSSSEPLINMNSVAKSSFGNLTDTLDTNGPAYYRGWQLSSNTSTSARGSLGYLSVDISRYTNTNQIPNFYIGAEANDANNYNKTLSYWSIGHLYSFYLFTDAYDGGYTTDAKNDGTPSGWTHWVNVTTDGASYASGTNVTASGIGNAYNLSDYVSDTSGARFYLKPSIAVSSDINAKFVHVMTQARAKYLTTNYYSNAYATVQFIATDKSDLRAAVLQATSLDATKYTTQSWRGASDTVAEEFLEALRDAAEVLGNPAASYNDIENATNNLNAKKNALKVAITFNASHNGGVFTDGETDKVYNIKFGPATSVNVASALLNYFNVAKAGYELAGWTTDPDAPANTASLDTVTVTFGDTLYAHFKKDIAVDFYYLTDLSGNTTVYTDTLTIYNNEDKALDVRVPDADNVGQYVFAGWTEDPMSTNGVKFEGTIDGVTESTVYYATYDQLLRLTLDANGGNCADAYIESGIGYNYDLTQTEGNAVITLPEVTKEGYSFLGWNIGGTRYQAGETITLTQNETATAEWAINVYEVVFNFKTAGGRDATVKVNVEYGQDATAPQISNYYYDTTYHYGFKGWDTTFTNVSGDTVVNAIYDNAILSNRHTYTSSGAPSCDHNVDVVFTCTTCSYSYTRTFEAGHEYMLTDSRDATCTTDGYKTYVCNRDSNHTYTEVIKATGHTPSADAVFTPATCTTQGYYESGTCTVCHEALTGVIAPLGHDYVVIDSEDPTCTADGYKTYMCRHDESHTYTETVSATGHSYTSTTISASCGKEGSVTYNCTSCGHSYVVVLDALEHHFSKMVINPTCTSQGYTATICNLCGISSREDYVPALGHDLTSVVVAPTCTQKGYTKHTCAVCNYSYKTDETAAIGHDYSIETEVAPTCTARGYILHTCANCNDTYKSDYVPATGHNYKFVSSVQATATMAGYHLYKCTECDSTYKEMQYKDGKALLCVTLYDTAGGKVTGATIVLTNNATGKQTVITTDANGYFTQVMPEGEYSVSITRSGYFCTETGSLVVELGAADLQLPTVEKNSCSCLCHQDTFWAQIYRFFIKMFSIFGQIYCCECCEIWD